MNSNSTSPESTAIKVSPATVGSFVLLVSFFLPWLGMLGESVAGFELHKIWVHGSYLWAIPAAAALAITLGAAGHRNMEVAQIAGGLPLVFLSLALYQFGSDLFKAITVGGYLTLVSGVFLLCVAPRLSRKTANASDSSEKTSPSTPHESEINR